MAKSILEIDVDDSQFKNYVAAFNKYQQALKETPKTWGEVDSVVAAIGAGFAAMTLELAAQAEVTKHLADEEAKRHKAEKEARDAEKKAAKEQADREKENEGRRRHAVQQSREIAKNVADTAISLGKWALLGEGAALLGGVLGMWGLDKLVSGIADERRLAQGFGVTTGERQALAINMQRYFDVNSLLENVAESQADPSRRWVFNAMGVRPSGDPAADAAAFATAAARIFKQGGGNEQWAQAHGLLSLFTMDELRRMTAPGADLPGGLSAARRDAAPGGRFFLSEEVGRKWQNFIVGLDGASQALKNKLVDKLTVLEPDLERIMVKFTDLAVKVLDRIDFDKLGKGLDTFTKYIGSPQFAKDFKTVIDDIAYAAKKLAGVMQLLGLLPDPKQPNTETERQVWDAADDARKNERLRRIGIFALTRDPSVFMKPLPETPEQAVAEWRARQRTGTPDVGTPAAAPAPPGRNDGSNWYGTPISRLPAGLLGAVYKAESASGRNAGYSSAGALGPFQFMPATAARYGVTDRTSYAQESAAAQHYLSDLLKEFRGDLSAAVAAYNWGEGNVERDMKRHGADWLRFAPRETRSYVQKVLVDVHNSTGSSVAATANAASR